MVQTAEPSSVLTKAFRRIIESDRLSRTFFVALFIVALTFVFAFATSAGTTGPPDSNPSQGYRFADLLSRMPWEIVLIAVTAFIFAWLRLLTDFHRYRGLLHFLAWNFYAWLFVVFTALMIIFMDEQFLPLIHKHIPEPGMAHIFLALGHTGASAVFVYASPIALTYASRFSKLIPVSSDATSGNQSLKKEQKITEMNQIYREVRELLDAYAHGRITKWLIDYDWATIRATAGMLVFDLENSEMVSRDEAASMRQQWNAFKESDDSADNMMGKYILVKNIVNLSSYWNVDQRLKQVRKAS